MLLDSYISARQTKEKYKRLECAMSEPICIIILV